MPAKKVVLIVVDGMTPAAFERAADGRAPALAFLAAHGDYRRGTSVFPSLTPVCLSSIATGAGPGAHHIPHLVWWHRGERRIVEYGSSFSALRAAGIAQSITDTIYNMNSAHLSARATTVYEALEDAGLVAAAVNITCYRGRTRHLPTIPWVTKAAYGPKRFFYYGLFESDATGAPMAVRNRAGQVYLLSRARADTAELAARLDDEPSVEVTLRLEDDEAVARREREELRFRPGPDGWQTSGDVSILDHPDALARSWSALENPNAGDLLVSAAEGWEFADLGGRHHAGGGSHGSLVARDSEVPLLTIGVAGDIGRITEITPAVRAHFGAGVVTADAV